MIEDYNDRERKKMMMFGFNYGRKTQKPQRRDIMDIKELITDESIGERNVKKQLMNVGGYLLDRVTEVNHDNLPEFLQGEISEEFTKEHIEENRALIKREYEELVRSGDFDYDEIYKDIMTGEETFSAIIEGVAQGLILSATIKAFMGVLQDVFGEDFKETTRPSSRFTDKYAQMNQSLNTAMRENALTEEKIKYTMKEVMKDVLEGEQYEEKLLTHFNKLIDRGMEVDLKAFEQNCIRKDVEPIELIMHALEEEYIPQLNAVNAYFELM